MGQVMVLIELDSAILVALISLFGTIFIGITNRQKFTKAEAITLEARLTNIENTLENKVEPIWKAIMNELPKMLISPGAPRLDILLDKAMKNREDMSNGDFIELKSLLKEEYDKAIENQDRTRGVALVLYMATLGMK